ncbi:MAG: response regulator [Candidatus Bathyarchaeia archaeon]|jgi:PAS domain S-box-containing protein
MNSTTQLQRTNSDNLFLEAGTQMAETTFRPIIELKLTDTECFLRVLHVDDDDSFLNVSKQILEMDGKIKVETAASVYEAFEKLKQFHYDVVVSDYEMPGKNGLQFLEELKKIAKSPPFILFTGRGREEVAVKALNLGAFRYLNKNGDPEAVYTELASSIEQAADNAKAQELAKQSEARFRAIFEASSDAIIVIDDDGKITNLNEAALQMFRCTREVIGQVFFERFSQQFPKASKQYVLEGIRKFASQNEGKHVGKKIRLPLKNGSGEERTVEMHASVFEENNRLYSIALIRDITERKTIPGKTVPALDL